MKVLLWCLSLSIITACGGASEDAAVGRSHSRAQDTGHAHHTKHHDFKDAEAWSKMFDDPERDAWQKPQVVLEGLRVEPGMVVADIGAGTGYFEGYLDKAVGPNGKVLAIDIAPQMVDFMEARAAKDGWKSVEARVSKLDDPGLEPASVDRVLIVNTWHHIGDRVRYAQKLHRALKPGGFVLVVDFNEKSPHGPPVEERLAIQEVFREFEEAGMTPEPFQYEALPYQYLARSNRNSALVAIPKATLLGGTLFGGQPSTKHLEELKAAGYRRVISLRTPEEPGFDDEKKTAAELGLEYLSIPVKGAEGLTETKAKALFLSLKDEPNTVVHCGSGNRAGTLMGLAARCAGASIEQALSVADHAGSTKLRGALEKKLREGLCGPGKKQ